MKWLEIHVLSADDTKTLCLLDRLNMICSLKPEWFGLEKKTDSKAPRAAVLVRSIILHEDKKHLWLQLLWDRKGEHMHDDLRICWHNDDEAQSQWLIMINELNKTHSWWWQRYMYIPGSSRYVKFLPFGIFFGWKGTNFTHLEDPGIYIYDDYNRPLLYIIYVNQYPQDLHPFATKVLPWCRGGLWRRRGVSADGRYAAIDRAHHYTGAVEKLWSFSRRLRSWWFKSWPFWDGEFSWPFWGVKSDLQRLGIKRSLWITWIWFFPLVFFLNLGQIFSSGNFFAVGFCFSIWLDFSLGDGNWLDKDCWLGEERWYWRFVDGYMSEWIPCLKPTKTLEKWWLGDYFPFGKAYF